MLFLPLPISSHLQNFPSTPPSQLWASFWPLGCLGVWHSPTITFPTHPSWLPTLSMWCSSAICKLEKVIPSTLMNKCKYIASADVTYVKIYSLLIPFSLISTSHTFTVSYGNLTSSTGLDNPPPPTTSPLTRPPPILLSEESLSDSPTPPLLLPLPLCLAHWKPTSVPISVHQPNISLTSCPSPTPLAMSLDDLSLLITLWKGKHLCIFCPSYASARGWVWEYMCLLGPFCKSLSFSLSLNRTGLACTWSKVLPSSSSLLILFHYEKLPHASSLCIGGREQGKEIVLISQFFL